MYYKLTITETSRQTLKEEPETFNQRIETFKSLDDVNRFIIDRYGKMPSQKNKVYQDKKDGTSEAVGFIKSYWNKDISHNSKNWYQTDWITITEVTEKPVLLNG